MSTSLWLQARHSCSQLEANVAIGRVFVRSRACPLRPYGLIEIEEQDTDTVRPASSFLIICASETVGYPRNSELVLSYCLAMDLQGLQNIMGASTRSTLAISGAVSFGLATATRNRAPQDAVCVVGWYLVSEPTDAKWRHLSGSAMLKHSSPLPSSRRFRGSEKP